MARGKGFELVPQAVPTRQRSGLYKEIITAFLSSGEQSVAVTGTDRKPVTLAQGLRKALEIEGMDDIKVVQRSHDVFLTKA